MAHEALSGDELREAWPLLSAADRVEGFGILPRAEADSFFLQLPALAQAALLRSLPEADRRGLFRLLAPDDAAALVRRAAPGEREALIALLDEATAREVRALLAYAADAAGGLMNPRYARVRPEQTVDEAVSYLRKQAREQVETLNYAYVLDPEQKLLGAVSIRDLLKADGGKLVSEVMARELVTVQEGKNREELAPLFQRHGFLALPVVDAQGRMKGLVTADDVLGVVARAATEDIQKLGGSESLGEPYLTIRFGSMIKKRGGWLSALFLGEMLTATAMGFFEREIDKAVVLALFVPLIISSGGNSGSQATSIVIRALALGELKLRDWWRVARRELASGAALGGILAVIGFTRILVWQKVANTYGKHWVLVGLTVSCSLIGVVTFGTIAGSLLPFILRKLGFDPASASAPFVATLVDVTGLIIYFSVAAAILRGTLL